MQRPNKPKEQKSDSKFTKPNNKANNELGLIKILSNEDDKTSQTIDASLNPTTNPAIVPVSRIEDQKDLPSNLSHSSGTHLSPKTVNICPPALRERGYEINEEIGGGAFSKVYKAKYKVLFDKDIAVKVISLDKVPGKIFVNYVLLRSVNLFDFSIY